MTWLFSEITTKTVNANHQNRSSSDSGFIGHFLKMKHPISNKKYQINSKNSPESDAIEPRH